MCLLLGADFAKKLNYEEEVEIPVVPSTYTIVKDCKNVMISLVYPFWNSRGQLGWYSGADVIGCQGWFKLQNSKIQDLKNLKI